MRRPLLGWVAKWSPGNAFRSDNRQTVANIVGRLVGLGFE